jgi:hypothetical protein
MVGAMSVSITKETSTQIAMAWREIETAEKMLSEITEVRAKFVAPDIRDAFGRHQNGLQLSVPSGESSHRLFNVPWSMCAPIIEAHILQQRQLVALLSSKAVIEMVES